MSDVLQTPEERLEELSDKLIAGVLTQDENGKQNRSVLFGSLVPNVFKNENHIIYKVLYNFKDKAIIPDGDFLKTYLMLHSKVIRDSKAYISLEEFRDLDEDENVAYITAVLKKYTRLLTFDSITYEEYKLILEKYKQEYSAYEIGVAYSQSKLILYDGVTIGNKYYQGFTDSTAYIKKKMADIDAIINRTTGAGFINSRVSALEEDETLPPEKIGDFDLINELNEHLGGIYTSIFYNIIAPTKGGKSKFTTRMAHTIVVRYGIPISVWAHEGGHKAWWAQIRAIHYEYLYIRGKPEDKRLPPLTQDQILHGKYPSEQIKAMERNSMIDLFSNPEYGNIYMIDRPFVAETFIEEVETSVQLNNSRFVLIDYLQLINSNNTSKSKPQYIGEAYQSLLSYAKKRNVAVCSPSQFKQETMNELAKSKDGKVELRTAGGESSEIVRTPDINIALYATIEDLMHKKMQILSMPSRLCQPFAPISIYADLANCLFSSLE